jgi:HSP20 family protein
MILRRLKMVPKITRSEPDGLTRNFPATPFRLFEDLFNDWALRSMEERRGNAWTPPVDILEKEGTLLLMASIPGLSEKEIDLKIEGQALTISGERKSQTGDGYICHQQESSCGTFSRSFTLPDSTDLGNIKAEYKNGVLCIAIPQKAEVRPRTIKIGS